MGLVPYVRRYVNVYCTWWQERASASRERTKPAANCSAPPSCLLPPPRHHLATMSTAPTATTASPTSVDLLILGAGWTSTFLIPLCAARGVTYAATTRTGRDGTIAFEFEPASDDAGPYAALPRAKTVLITFPIYVPGASARLVRLYQQTHPDPEEVSSKTAFIQLGSTGIWDVSTLEFQAWPRG